MQSEDKRTMNSEDLTNERIDEGDQLCRIIGKSVATAKGRDPTRSRK